MKKNYRKAIVLSMALSALLALPTTTFAQREKQGGLFGTDPTANDVQSGGMLNPGNNRDGASITGNGIQNDDFGTPLGSGIAIFLVAGAGYVALKKKKEDQQ